MITCPDPNARYTERYLTDLLFREQADIAHAKARALTCLWRTGEFAIAELPCDAEDLNTNDYY